MWHDLPSDIHVMIMSSLPDVHSLLALVRADTISSKTFVDFFNQIFPCVLANSMPFDLQKLVCIAVSIQNAAPFRNSELDFVLKESVIFNERIGRFRFVHSPSDPIEALQATSRISVAVDYFVRKWPRFWSVRRKDFRGRSLSKLEIRRLRRSMWRLEVCSALVKAWKPSGDCGPCIIPSEINSPYLRVALFTDGLTACEVEELCCVNDFLEQTVKDVIAQFCERIHKGKTSMISVSPALQDFVYRFPNWPLSYPPPCPLLSQMTLGHEARTATELLLQGIVFLYEFQQELLANKEHKEQHLEILALGNRFIHAALCYRFAQVQDLEFSKRNLLRIRNDNDDVSGQDRNVEKADKANGHWTSSVINGGFGTSWSPWSTPLTCACGQLLSPSGTYHLGPYNRVSMAANT